MSNILNTAEIVSTLTSLNPKLTYISNNTTNYVTKLQIIVDSHNTGETESEKLGGLSKMLGYEIKTYNTSKEGIELFIAANNKFIAECQKIESNEAVINEDNMQESIKGFSNSLVGVTALLATSTFAGDEQLQYRADDLKFLQNEMMKKLKQFQELKANTNNIYDNAIDTINDALKAQQQLNNCSFDKNEGNYSIPKDTLDWMNYLDMDADAKELVRKGYVTVGGEITKKGFEYIEENCKTDINKISPDKIDIMLQIMCYADTEEEIFGLLAAGYSDQHLVTGTSGTVWYEPTTAFKYLVLNVDKKLAEMKLNGTIKNWDDYYNRLSCLYGILDILNVCPKLQSINGLNASFISDEDEFKSFLSEKILIHFERDGNHNITKIVFREKYVMDRDILTRGVEFDIFKTNGTALRRNAFNDAYCDSTRRMKEELFTDIALDVLSFGVGKLGKYVIEDFEKIETYLDVEEFIVKYQNELNEYYSKKNLSNSINPLEILENGAIDIGSSKTQNEIENIRRLERITNLSDVSEKLGLYVAGDCNNGNYYVAMGENTEESIQRVNSKIEILNGYNNAQREELYNTLTVPKSNEMYDEYSIIKKILFPNGINGQMTKLEEINIESIPQDFSNISTTIEILDVAGEI